jgi:hypothetical protein
MLRRLIPLIRPLRVRRKVEMLHRGMVLKRAILQLRADPGACLDPGALLVEDLIYGWGNEDWSASPEYLAGCVRETLNSQGPILECGSGLTTVVVGIIADLQGISLHTLEHVEIWGEQVQRALARFGAKNVHLHVSPLTDYGDYQWYSAPHEIRQRRFSLVLCDGPPSATRGGRYGLIPVMRDHLDSRCVILLDDAIREEEQAIADRWQGEAQLSYSKVGRDRPYFRLTTP